jgi:hypothetical protein
MPGSRVEVVEERAPTVRWLGRIDVALIDAAAPRRTSAVARAPAGRDESASDDGIVLARGPLVVHLSSDPGGTID